MTDYSKLDSKELLQYWKNAWATYSGAIGHQKSYRNECAAKHYAEILTERGIKIPDDSTGGIYNGYGSS